MTPLSLELRRLMEVAEVSQSGLAAMMGVEPSTVSRWMSGETVLSVARIRDVAEALAVPYATETLLAASVRS